jgi:cytochrome c peroxidase
LARERLEGVYRAHPGLTYADLYTLAAVVAVEEMGGPTIKWRPGRDDHKDGKKSPADGRLPDAAQGAQHVRDIFYRMGFNDQEIVALVGAHSLGRCHKDRSGYEGPWTFSPTTFSNEYFRLLLEEKWQPRRWKGPLQYEDVKTKSLMMLPADMALIEDPEFRKYVVQYAKDGDKFAKDFATAFGKLLELGVEFKTTDGSSHGKNESLWKRIFG